MISQTHLYRGFRHVGLLPSIMFQRQAQKKSIKESCHQDNKITMLFIGCGYGEELDALLSGHESNAMVSNIIAIDIAPVESYLLDQPFVTQKNLALIWRQLNLFNIHENPEFGHFDLVQCGFVLHDIEFSNKQSAFDIIGKAVRPGGRVIVSDIYVSESALHQDALDDSYMQEVGCIYDRFLNEVQQVFKAGCLLEEDMNELLGNGQTPGLLKTSKDAMDGKRDFFDSIAQTVARMRQSGLEVDEIICNPHNDKLAVLLAHRTI